MKTVAIISEYNPFHNGHLYQIQKIREEFGDDTAIIAIMSGNFTQRGEIAIMEKWKRAEAAVMCGVNLVLELPFPYSMSSAELFARAGVHIAKSLGVVDVLSFGSESGDLSALTEIAENMRSEKFNTELKALIESDSHAGSGYPTLLEAAYERAFEKKLPDDIFKANNILALEYIKAIEDLSAGVVPHTLKRSGQDYRDTVIFDDDSHKSATAIREALKNGHSAEKYIPKYTNYILTQETEAQNAPTDQEKLSSLVLANLTLSNSSADPCQIHDAEGGLYNRLKSMSFEAKDISSLIVLSETKKYTTARIRRAIWNSYFGVTSSDIKELPTFTQVLALDNIGRTLLNKAKKDGGICIITKPSHTFTDEKAKRQKEFSDRADIVFQFSKPVMGTPSSVYKHSPFVKK